MRILSFLLVIVVLASCVSPGRKPQSEVTQGRWFTEKLAFEGLPAQRVGYFLEAPGTQLRGCVIYLEGLGDSIANHTALWYKLSDAGYRVLLFDYLGQGKSEGDMADMRLDHGGPPYPVSQKQEIGYQAQKVWELYSRVKDPVYGRDCSKSKKLVIGWSTGGLAAYKLAHENWSDASILIAPGIAPNLCVGEAAPYCQVNPLNPPPLITLRTLTTRVFDPNQDPHVDPIRPNSPLKVKRFAWNLIVTAYQSRQWKLDTNKKGLVFLSGKEDTYVDRELTQKVLKANAPGFQLVTYDGALHEIDNEIQRIAEAMQTRTIEFLNSATQVEESVQ